MPRPDPDLPTPYEAILLEPDAAGRQLVLDRAQRMFLAKGGEDLELLIHSQRDSVRLYNESKQAQRANPEAKPIMAHREGQRAAVQLERLIEKHDRLRDRCVDFARRAIFSETGKRYGPGLWPEDLPKEEPREQPIQLPDPADSWPTARNDGEVADANKQWGLALSRTGINIDGVAEMVVSGKIGPADLQMIDQELRQHCPDLPAVPDEFKRRLVEAVKKLRAKQPSQPSQA